MSRVIPLLRPNPNTPLNRLERAIALSVELRALLAPGFGTAVEFTDAEVAHLAAAEVRMRTIKAVLTSSGPEAA